MRDDYFALCFAQTQSPSTCCCMSPTDRAHTHAGKRGGNVDAVPCCSCIGPLSALHRHRPLSGLFATAGFLFAHVCMHINLNNDATSGRFPVVCSPPLRRRHLPIRPQMPPHCLRCVFSVSRACEAFKGSRSLQARGDSDRSQGRHVPNGCAQCLC